MVTEDWPRLLLDPASLAYGAAILVLVIVFDLWRFARAKAGCRARLQQYVPGWEVFRRLDEDPEAFPSYRPGRLKKGFYPLDIAPVAMSSGTRIGGVRMSQHNRIYT